MFIINIGGERQVYSTKAELLFCIVVSIFLGVATALFVGQYAIYLALFWGVPIQITLIMLER